MSRGILFTVSLTLISLVVFSFASTIMGGYEEKRGEEAQLLVVERVGRTYDNLEWNVREIFSTSGVETAFYGDVVSFTEELPNEESVDFVQNVERYAEFAEKKGVDLETDEMTEYLTLRVEPYGGLYSHEDYGGNDLFFSSPQTPELYRFHITLSDGGLQRIDWDPYESGSLPVNIYVQGQQSGNETRLINPSGLTVANVTLNGNRGVISIRFEGGNMTATSYVSSTVEIQTNVTVDEVSKIVLPGALKVWVPGTGASRNSTARVV